MKQVMKTYTFKSGIRKIEVEAETLEKAKRQLHYIVSNPFSDPTWNWRIYVGNKLVLDGEDEEATGEGEGR